MINKVSTGQRRECSPKISGDPNINTESKYNNLFLKCLSRVSCEKYQLKVLKLVTGETGH